MKIMSHTYQDKVYDFTLTMAAKKEINDLQFKMFDQIKNPEIFTIMADSQILGMELKKANDEKEVAVETENAELVAQCEAKLQAIQDKQNAMMMKMMPSMREYMSLMQDQVDPLEVATILLMNNIKYRKDMTGDFAREILEDMECELGFEEFNVKMDELIDKVFTMISLVNDRREKVMEKINKPKEKIEEKLLN